MPFQRTQKVLYYILYYIKEIIWPIKKEEVKLFLPMALLMFCILFNFGALRSVKDGLVIPSIGAEVISFLKLWLVLPSSVIFTLIYVTLSNIFNFEYIFYIVISVFLGFFLLFAYVLYPNQELYHPTVEVINRAAINYPNFQWFIKIAGKWSYAVMYIFSELWSGVIINLMFWQFANHIFSTEHARRFYPLLGMIGNLGLILAGNTLVFFTAPKNLDDLLMDTDTLLNSACKSMLQPILTIIVFSGVLAMILFRFINKSVLPDIYIKNQKTISYISSTKTKLSIAESFRMILKSGYIGYIAVLIICYGLLINILEGPWKSKVKELYPTTIEYINFMGHFNIWMGVSSVIFTIIASNVLRRTSWLFSAILTPLMLSITGLMFFTFVIFFNNYKGTFFAIHFDLLYAAIIVGAVQNILSKSAKYSLFDSTKEMAYIPLSLELRTKGKAAVEVICSKFGKSLGAFIQSITFIIIPTATFDSITVYLLVIFLAVVAIWYIDVLKLNREYTERVR